MSDIDSVQPALIAILRGIRPQQANEVADTLIDAGFRCIEVPLNSPSALESIENLARHCGDRCLVGAGTVTRVEDVEQVSAAGGKLIVSPNCNQDVIRRTKQLDLTSVPGCVTPSEAFAALDAGADALKLFPAEIMSPAAVAAIRSVLPASSQLWIVGGIHAGNMPDYLNAGANGFGIGSSLFKPGKSLQQIASDAKSIVQSLAALSA